ncbi:MAG: hypothetical protein JNK46_04950 [Methylobacteriaceae bacterium]|nr:hypothetical protein [Methylobacteriaceae bacterium]
MAIATETIYWSDSDGARTMKLVRAARALRMAAITDPGVYIIMIGLFPKSSGSDFANAARAHYVKAMREARDSLVAFGVWENAIDGYIPYQEAPTTQFVYTVTVDTGVRKNPFPTLESTTLEEAQASSGGGGGGESEAAVKRKFVIDPFDEHGVALKAQLELDITDATGRRLNLPGEFAATFEIVNGRLKEVGVEWTAVQRKLKDRIARGAIRNVVISISLSGKAEMSESQARQIFGGWGAEAKATLGADLHIKSTKIRVELGAKAETGEGPGPVLEISF